ncbi:phosphotransferase family protein [Streptomyces sp. AC1-42W]|uniref:phosphotransferase family protein n=1 Tax=Streptomyces sp. AC1-42W TaxID=2218666 RepID=UPI000DAE5BA7|nr:aminoglycoside phosphotransferase family protein [Streptomyces sp. AC1-42W]PZT74872.1 aminoglycoside phosphotransferase family protein [Streptomyces sp. AC1-42T]PZT82144.1 aminoglycoside phosphotransferase family protein [Streptomyces sp. AC1-42W]
MDFQPVERASEAFQQSVTAQEIAEICRRAFGPEAVPVSAVELGTGMYNNVYCVALAGRAEPVILRVAPEEGRQFRSERHLMRNEYAAQPWLAVIAPLMPRVLAADWSHEVIGRDWMIQTCLDGVPAPERLGAYPRTQWSAFFGQMGAIARSVHHVRGPHFGPVGGPGHGTWSEAVIASLEEIAADLDGAGLDAGDVRKVAAVAAHGRAALDEVTEPRLLTGDLWTVNALLDPKAPEPVITGVLDFDRAWFGDPAADWTIRMATAKQDERTAFWETYGAVDRSPAAVWRAGIYEARHLAAIRLERHRLGKADAVRESYDTLAGVLAALA